jgi:PKD repeat protein
MMKSLRFAVIAALFSICSISSAQTIQTDPVPVINDLQSGFVNGPSYRATSCGSDTVGYPLAKTTGLQALIVNGFTSARAICQYFNAPQDITISGLTFYGWKTDTTGGITQTVDIDIYMAGPDSLPNGAPISSTTIIIDTTFGTGNLSELRKDVSLPVVTVNAPYLVVIGNNAFNSISLIFNDWTANPRDGLQEWLASADLGGTWTRGYNLTVGGVDPFDCDMICSPWVTYDLFTDFSMNAPCLPGTVNFTNNSAPILWNRMYNQSAFFGQTSSSFTWDFGDATPVVNAIDTMHTYTGSGPYNVLLTDTLFGWTSNCWSDTLIATPAASTIPNAAFTYTTSGFQGVFTDISTGGSTSWLWDFGDGNTSTMQNPTHIYANNGTYTVCLTVSNACGADSSCTTVTISCIAPTAGFTSSSSDLDATFTDVTVGNLSSWLWDFGDGNTSTMQHPNHTYANPGTYMVCLTVTDSCGTDSTCAPIIITCPVPAAGFTYTTGIGDANFASTSTGATSWLWDFGDGNNSTQENPTHLYGNNGTYVVCLTVTNTCGVDSSCTSVTIMGLDVSIRDLESQVSVHPNPTSNTLQIQLSSEIAAVGSVRLLNSLGQQLIAEELQGRLIVNWDVSNLAQGSYFLHLKTDMGKVVKRIEIIR